MMSMAPRDSCSASACSPARARIFARTLRHRYCVATSSSAAMLAAAVAPLAAGDPAKYGALAAATAIGTGLLLLLGGVLRLGFVSDFIAKPVLKGFTFGLALRIIVKQAPALLGITKGSGDVFAQAGHVLSSLGDAHGPTVVVGLGALALVILLPRLTRALPPALVALAGRTPSEKVASTFFVTPQTGVPVLVLPLFLLTPVRSSGTYASPRFSVTPRAPVLGLPWNVITAGTFGARSDVIA